MPHLTRLCREAEHGVLRDFSQGQDHGGRRLLRPDPGYQEAAWRKLRRLIRSGQGRRAHHGVTANLRGGVVSSVLLFHFDVGLVCGGADELSGMQLDSARAIVDGC